MPLLSRADIGRPVNWSILADTHPARIVSAPQIDSSAGPARQVVEIVVFRQTRDGGPGSEYLSTRIVGAQFLQRRTERVEALDGKKNAPKSVAQLMDEAQASFAEYQAQRAQVSDITSLEAELAD